MPDGTPTPTILSTSIVACHLPAQEISGVAVIWRLADGRQSVALFHDAPKQRALAAGYVRMVVNALVDQEDIKLGDVILSFNFNDRTIREVLPRSDWDPALGSEMEMNAAADRLAVPVQDLTSVSDTLSDQWSAWQPQILIPSQIPGGCTVLDLSAPDLGISAIALIHRGGSNDHVLLYHTARKTADLSKLAERAVTALERLELRPGWHISERHVAAEPPYCAIRPVDEDGHRDVQLAEGQDATHVAALMGMTPDTLDKVAAAVGAHYRPNWIPRISAAQTVEVATPARVAEQALAS